MGVGGKSWISTRAVKAQSKRNEDRSHKVEGVGKVVPIM